MIPFNKVHLTGKETQYLNDVLTSGKIAGDGKYAKLCESFFEKRYKFLKAYITTSCTHALEMAALLIDIKPGDEVIMPSFTFVSSATAFVLRGAKIVFADSCVDSPNVNVSHVEQLITPATKAILAIHYAGICCGISKLRQLADHYGIYLIEDAAQAIDSYHNGKPAGSFGHLGTFSFHETKNITCGEGGLLIINEACFVKRAEILREKGTNRSSFLRQEVDKYTWVDIGSSYVPSDILAAYLLAQLQALDDIQQRRKNLWDQYYAELKTINIKGITLPVVNRDITHNAHTFYFVCSSTDERNNFINYMLENGVQVQSHYMPLHTSPFYQDQAGIHSLPKAERYRDGLVRLPLFYDLTIDDIKFITSLIRRFFSIPF